MDNMMMSQIRPLKGVKNEIKDPADYLKDIEWACKQQN